MNRIVYKDYFLTASVGCKVEPHILFRKRGTIIYPDGTSLKEQMIELTEGKPTPAPSPGGTILISTGEALLTSGSEEILFT